MLKTPSFILVITFFYGRMVDSMASLEGDNVVKHLNFHFSSRTNLTIYS